MLIKRINHIQLAMPPGKEDEARAFYNGILGIPEKVKPKKLAKRGGVWFESETLKAHLGVEAEFRPAKKAHPGFAVINLKNLSQIFKSHGYAVTEGDSIPGCSRIFVNDPFGNRLEFMDFMETLL